MESLDLRKQQILRAVVREHILNAEPVGSRLLVDQYLPDVSSATVRNEMSALEELGYLDQPHTSAGRIPTERGYRYYVNSIMDADHLTGGDERIIKNRLDAINHQVEEVLQDVSFILSRLTSLLAVSVAQAAPKGRVLRLDLVLLSRERLLVVLVTSDGQVERILLDVERGLSERRTRALERLINDVIGNRDLTEVLSLRQVLQEKVRGTWSEEWMSAVCMSVVDAVAEMLGRSVEGKIFIDGANYMLGQPEFSQSEKARRVLVALEERSRVLDLIEEVVSTQQVVIKIGSELASLSAECSFVGASYRMADGGTGVLGILGPVRMNYARAVASVSAVADELSAIV